MYTRMNKKTGFTLIELLIVVSIIGILAGMLLANFAGVRGRARDAKRKSELDSIKKALQMYYTDYQEYPDDNGSGDIMGCGGDGTGRCYWGSEFSADGNVYMGRLPEDPQNQGDYVYEYVREVADSYCLVATLENEGDDAADDSQTRCSDPCSTVSADATTYFVCGN